MSIQLGVTKPMQDPSVQSSCRTQKTPLQDRHACWTHVRRFERRTDTLVRL
jgi:hypothetical protein